MRKSLLCDIRSGGVRLAILFSVAVIAGVLLFVRATGEGDDQDGDGMHDGFELFFGLTVGSDDGAGDPDADGLDNLGESAACTDPFNPDTDLDGWPDDVDADPLSRAVYLWGEPRFTRGETNLYTRPAWALNGIAEGGAPSAGGDYAYSWTLGSPGDRLLMSLDRTRLSNDIWLAVAAAGNASVSVGLLDSNLVALTDPVMLGDATPPWLTNRLPLSSYGGANVISIQNAQGVVSVVASVLYEDADGDGFDEAQNAQLVGGGGAALQNTLPPSLGGQGMNGSGTNAAAPSAGAALSEGIGFETDEGYAAGALDGQQGWSASEGMDVSAGSAFEGAQHLLVRAASNDNAPNTAVRAVGAGFTNNVLWASFRTKCVAGGSRPASEGLGAASFAIEGDRVVAFDGISRQWVASAQAFPGVTGLWARVDFRLDYGTKTFTLCFQGVVTHRDIGFANPAIERPVGLTIKNGSGGDSAVDAIIFSEAEPEGLDFDGDGLVNARERELGADIWSGDTDGDGLPDADEVLIHGSSPLLDDSDGDGLPDPDEVLVYGSNPSLSDTDGDGLPDADEVLIHGSSPVLADSDGDGMGDWFELLFGLNVKVPDSIGDPDRDEVNNLGESVLGTDPFSSDTDLDGWTDFLDASPVSRAVYRWGEPRLTRGVTNVYVRPAWASDGFAQGGSSYAGGAFGAGWLLRGAGDRLIMPVDRGLVSNDLWLAVAVTGLAPSGFSASLLGADHAIVAGPFPLAAASTPWMTNRLPLAAWPEASAVAFHSTQSMVYVAASVLYEDADGDGFDNAQNVQLWGGGGAALQNTLPPSLGGQGICGFGTNAAISSAGAALSEGIGFETDEGYTAGALNGQQGWSASEGIDVSAGSAFEGAQHLLVRAASNDSAPNTAVRAVGAGFTNNVLWASFRTKCVAGGSRPASEGLGAASFAIEGDRVVAFDGISRQWVASAQAFPGVTGLWARVDSRLDYGTKTFTLCFQGVVTHRDIGFANPAIERPVGLTIKNGTRGDSAVDSVTFSSEEPEGIDFDGDGIPNVLERLLGTDIWTGDTDCDGIPDYDELVLDGDPLGYDADFDGDGISNSDETSLLGTDPTLADSDGDGIRDSYGIADLAGSAFSCTSGVWTVSGDVLAANEGKGKRVGYAVSLPSPGFRLVEIHFSNSVSSAEDYHLALHCDDARIAEWAAPVPPDGLVWRVLTPWLPAGTNLFRLAWVEDTAAGRRLDILRFRVSGIDASGDGARALWCAASPAAYDGDGDALADVTETGVTLTAPTRFDTDGDALWDGDEVNVFRLNPLLADSGGDGVPDAAEVACRAGAETAARYVTHISTDFKRVGDALVWAESTASSCAYDLSVETPGFHVLEINVRNYLHDPPAGYLFDFRASLLGREIGTMRISGDVDRTGTGRLITPWLPAGIHRFKIDWKNRVVEGERVSRPALERVRLLAVNGEDADGDGIQDWMKERLLASAADSDGDGLKDRDEVLVFRTSPLSTDSDGDGLADKAETLLGSDPLNPDSDGDGLADGDESAAGTDPLSAEFDGVWTPAVSLNGGEFVKSSGPWSRDVTGALAQSRGRGWIEYEFETPASDLYMLRLNAEHVWWNTSCPSAAPESVSDFLVYVDGLYVGRFMLHSPAGISGQGHLLLPFMSAGAHRVRLFWNAVNERFRLRISEIAVGTFGGADADADGIRDWVAGYAARTNRVTVAPAASHLSPACVEGTARWPLLASAATAAGPVEVRPGVAGQWFADLPLDPSGAPAPLSLSFENGANTVAVAVVWSPLDLVTGITTLNARLGDTLRLGVPPDGAAVLTVVNSGGTVYGPAAVDPAAPLDVALTADGPWIFTTQWTPVSGPPLTRALAVNVYGGSLPPEEPACMLGRQRLWECPGLTPGVKLQAGSGVSLSWSGTNAAVTVSRMYAEHFIVARAGAGGPVLDSRRVNQFWVQAAVDSMLRIVEKRADTQLWEQRMVCLNLPVTVTLEVRIFVGGVTFEDLSLVKTMDSAAIGDAGDVRFRMIRSNSISSSTCHTIKAYQDGILVGEAYYLSIGLPQDLR